MDKELKTLRYRVAEALYLEGGKAPGLFSQLSQASREAWLQDADRVIPIVIEAACRVVDQRQSDKESAYLIRRESLSGALQGLFLGGFECPIDDPDCVENCGAYGCGN